MSRLQVATGQFFGVGGRGDEVPQMSSPRNLSSNNFLLPAVDGLSVADCRAISRTSPQMCPWQL